MDRAPGRPVELFGSLRSVSSCRSRILEQLHSQWRPAECRSPSTVPGDVALRSLSAAPPLCAWLRKRAHVPPAGAFSWLELDRMAGRRQRRGGLSQGDSRVSPAPACCLPMYQSSWRQTPRISLTSRARRPMRLQNRRTLIIQYSGFSGLMKLIRVRI